MSASVILFYFLVQFTFDLKSDDAVAPPTVSLTPHTVAGVFPNFQLLNYSSCARNTAETTVSYVHKKVNGINLSEFTCVSW